MVTYLWLDEVPPAVLVYFVGRWTAIAQIEANAGSGRGHAVELHALVAAATAELQRRGDRHFSNLARDLGKMITASYHEVDLISPVSDATLLRSVNIGLLL